MIRCGVRSQILLKFAEALRQPQKPGCAGPGYAVLILHLRLLYGLARRNATWADEHHAKVDGFAAA